MSHDAYSTRVRERYFNPGHVGQLADAVTVQVDDQGLRLSLCAKTHGDVLEKLAFRAWGCPHFIAGAETVCCDFEGRRVAELLEFSANDLMDQLAVPVEKTGRILVLEDAVRALGRRLEERRTDD